MRRARLLKVEEFLIKVLRDLLTKLYFYERIIHIINHSTRNQIKLRLPSQSMEANEYILFAMLLPNQSICFYTVQ